ncbi:MAG: hypothetical protein J6X81_04260 [Muribaculaceae bacterium]|nr:hypothetical protein [Muribaculaceae bacterium]
MAEIGYGYGSEWQLLRYLGHHRNYLNKEILKALKLKNEQIIWKDYPVNKNRLSMDGELTGIKCFEKCFEKDIYKRIDKAWKTFWPQSGTSHNWDGVFTIGEKWFFVEAKAHLDEAHQKCGAKKEESIHLIKSAFEETSGSSELGQQWFESDCYQLANRLAFIKFCENQGIKAKLIYINFLNGWIKNESGFKSVLNQIDWEKVWEEEYKTLSLTKKHKDSIVHVYIDCLKG